MPTRGLSWQSCENGPPTPSLRDAVASDQRTAAFNDVAARSGKVTLHSARSYTPALPDTHAALIVRTGLSEQWLGIILDVEDKPPHRIVELSFNQARPPTDVPKGERLTDAQIALELGAYVERLAKQDAFSGTVLLAKDGEPILTLAVGLANRDFKAPNTLDTRFNLGSMNKMFTAVAVLQLAEKGQLSLDDTLAKHLDSSWLSQAILDGGAQFCTLFTDLANPTSNRIYQRLGYRPLCDFTEYSFKAG